MINSILSNYDVLYNGGALDRKSNKPLPSIEELTSSVKNSEVLKTLVDSKTERAQTYQPRLPFSLQELEENNSAEIPLNKSIIRSGTEDNYQAIRSVGDMGVLYMRTIMGVLRNMGSFDKNCLKNGLFGNWKKSN